MTDAVKLFDAYRAYKRAFTGHPLDALDQADVDDLNAAIHKAEGRWKARTAPPAAMGAAAAGVTGGAGAASPVSGAPAEPTGQFKALLTPRVALELISHEAIVQEAYKDSVGVWTWGVGVTSRSGHSVERYKDNPQTIRRCLEIYIWLLIERYIPAVEKAFAGHPMTEARFAAALSFHYNTGAIRKTSWVDLWLAGDSAGARLFLETHYLNNGDLTERRKKEAALFFDGKWSSDGKATVYPVRKPGYTPHWSGAKRIDVRADLEALLA